MSIIFTCEHCGKRFKVKERVQGRRGRCSSCGHVMKIPGAGAVSPAQPPAAAATPAAEPAFRLSPPEPRTLVDESIAPPAAKPAADRPEWQHDSNFAMASSIFNKIQPDPKKRLGRFELLEDDDPAELAPVPPAVKRGLQEIAEFERDPRGYKIVGDRSGVFSFLGVRDLGPASWLYTKWRAGINVVLKLFRWVDTWAYLISVPFLMLMIFGIVIENRQFVNLGAVAVVLANYGRFWADLFAFFVRPYKDGPLHGILFLFPPYTLYYVVTRWDGMKKILRRIAMSCIPIILVILIYGFLPSVNPGVKDVQGIGAKLEAGKNELDNQIASDLKRVEKTLIEIGQPEKHASEPPP